MKIYRTMLYLIIAISMMYALPGYATTWEYSVSVQSGQNDIEKGVSWTL
jgi:hypothetical protein